MKFQKLSVALVALMISSLTFTSCKDDKKEAEKMRMETEKVDMENAKKAEQEQMDMKAKEDAMKMDQQEKSIAGMAMKNNDLSTLVTALKAADLATMLSESGAYTVFAPSNEAFAKLPKATLDALLMPENKDMLKGVLQYHVVAGKITSDQLAAAIKGAKGSYKFKTVTGDELTASMKGDQFIITDATGKKAQVILGNQDASNGIVHVIDAVLMAKK
ncbi:MAG: fasciclin domain-containing protein [Aquaticitalea sp.]